MIKFVARRLLQMIPTLFGVLVITFILFNLVGGSPALIKLGKNAQPQSLEEFDEQRGFNKPSIFGYRTTTRAFSDQNLRVSAGPWMSVSGTQYTVASAGRPAGLVIEDPAQAAVPLAFPLRAETRYEWTIESLPPGATAPVARRVVCSGDAAAGVFSNVAPGTLVLSMRLRRMMSNPFDSQFAHFILQILRGDLGTSSSQNLPVSTILLDGIGPTLGLAVPILLLELIAAVSLALGCAYFRGRWPDRAMVASSTVLLSVNYLVWIVAGQYFLAFKWGWFPVWGFASWAYLALPILIGAFSGLGAEVRFYRAVMLDEMYKDYVRTAYAKGAGPLRVLFRHVLPNAAIPIVTNVVLSLPFLYTGSLLLESFFGIPGLGYLGVNAINDADVDVVRAIVLIGSLLYMAANLLADVLYSMLDPRVRLS